MKTEYIIAALSLITVLCGSCKKEIDFSYHDIEPIPVAEAYLSQKGAEVTLTLTTPMDEPMDRRHLKDAEVTLYNLDRDEWTVLEADRSGIYRSPLPGVTGDKYRMIIERNGEIYVADGVMYGGASIVSAQFDWIKMPYDYVAVLQVEFMDNPDDDNSCYWIRLLRNGEAYMWQATTDAMAVDGVVKIAFMTSRKDLDEEDGETALRYGDEVTVMVQQISRDMFDYIMAIGNNSSGGWMWQGNHCLGFFLPSWRTEKTVEFTLE